MWWWLIMQTNPIWKKAPPGHPILMVLYWPNPSVQHLEPDLDGPWGQALPCNPIIKQGCWHYCTQTPKIAKTQSTCESTGPRQAKVKMGYRSMLFSTFICFGKALHLCCLFKNEMKAKSIECKVPSINMHCFLYPSLLFCHSRAVFTRVPIFDRKAKWVKELDRSCLLW